MNVLLHHPFLFEFLFLFHHFLLRIHLHLEYYGSQSFGTKLSHCTLHKIGQIEHSAQKAGTGAH